MSNDTMYLMDNLSVHSHLYQLIAQHVRASQAHGLNEQKRFLTPTKHCTNTANKITAPVGTIDDNDKNNG